jgi:hypothetical protein
MSKFDLVYEKMWSLLRENSYVSSTLVDNLQQLVKLLSSKDFLPKQTNTKEFVKQLLNQPNNVKEINLDTQENALPPIKLKVSQDSSDDSETFTVTVINLSNPKDQKTFQNSMMETIFEDVVSYIQTIALQGLQPDSAVEPLPPSEGGNAQPGAEASALPTEPTSPPQ